jgi:hypothetical protein
MWLVVVVTALTSAASGSTQKPNAEQASLARARELMVEVMKSLVAGDDSGALELLRPHLPVPKAEFDKTRDNTLKTRKSLRDRFGKIMGSKLVREERASDFLIRFTYAEKRAKHLMRWQFTFYRPGTEWQLNSFNWDDNVSLLFSAADSAR